MSRGIRGAFIVVEGVDRCGKTSQTLKLIESLKKKNIPAERMAFPDRSTWTGQIISKYLSDKDCKLSDQAIHLLFTANRWEKADQIIQSLNNGVTLVMDRYSYSGIAFSAAKGMNLNWCSQPEIGLPKPDLVIFLNIKPEDQKNRPGFGTERYETSVFQEKVTKIFHTFAKTEDNWKELDACRTFEEVHKEMLQKIEEQIANIGNNKKPIQYFVDFNNDENFPMNCLNLKNQNGFKN